MSHEVRRSFVISLVLVLAGAALALIAAPSANAATTFVVDNTTDDGGLSACTLAPGDCSLWGAVAAANANAGVDTIDFLIPGVQCPGGVCLITLTGGIHVTNGSGHHIACNRPHSDH